MSADELRAKLSAPAPEARPGNAADSPRTRGKHYEDDRMPNNGDAIETLPSIVVQPDIQALPCTGCVIDAKQAAMLGKDIPEPLPGTVMVQGMLLCDVRHTLNVGAPQLLIAQPGQVPGGLG